MIGYWFAVALLALCIYFMWVGERREEERQLALRIAELEWMARDLLATAREGRTER